MGEKERGRSEELSRYEAEQGGTLSLLSHRKAPPFTGSGRGPMRGKRRRRRGQVEVSSSLSGVSLAGGRTELESFLMGQRVSLSACGPPTVAVGPSLPPSSSAGGGASLWPRPQAGRAVLRGSVALEKEEKTRFQNRVFPLPRPPF